MIKLASLVATLGVISSLGAATLTFDASDTPAFDALFPTKTRTGTAGSWTILDTNPDRLQVHAQLASDGQATFSRATVYSDSLASGDQFLNNAVAYAFNNASMTTGAGTANSAYFGVTSGNTAGISSPSGPNDALYFSINHSNVTVTFVQRYNGTNTTLATFSLTDTVVATRFNFETLSFTVTGSTYSATVRQAADGGTDQTISGSFVNAINADNWGTNTYLAVQADSPYNTAARFSNALVESISVTAIPEPSAFAFTFGTAALLGTALRRRR